MNTDSSDRSIPTVKVMSAGARRRHRVRKTIMILAVLSLAGAGGGYGYYRMKQPTLYTPGEEMSDITQNLAENLPPGAPQVRLEDVTNASGLGVFRSFAGDRTSQLPEDMGCGAAWGDFDNDGDDDLFIVSSGASLGAAADERAPCMLFENLGDGTFRPVESFPATRIIGMGCAWGDYNGDGWLDLIVTGYNTLLLFRNDAGVLSREMGFENLPGFWAGASWGDFDNDRDLDLYVCGYVEYKESEGAAQRESLQYGTALPYTLNPSSFEPARNLLFRNDGDGKLVEVAESMGVANPQGRSLSAVWHDFDQDGWLDLYVANDISDNAFYRNVEGRFVEISHAAWVADYRGAMGLAVGDYDRDGDDDLFVSHWTAQENGLFESMLVDYRDQQGPLRTGQEDKETSDELDDVTVQFVDSASAIGLGQIALQRIGWGAEFADFDADGWLDLVVANGSTFETDTAPHQLRTQQSFLFWNRGGDYFHDLAPASSALVTPHVTRGLALSDYDRDGDLDLLLVHRDQGVQLLRNDMQTGHWLEIRLRNRIGDGSVRGFGDGSTVTVYVGDIAFRRSINSASYLSQSSRVLHFGLGSETTIDRVEVNWLGGETETYEAIEVDQTWELREGERSPIMVSIPATLDDRQRILKFWETQRAAVRAMKVENDLGTAITLFREALSLDPGHEDARFYLANCLATQGDLTEAITELNDLIRRNPRSHRVLKQLALLKVEVGRTPDDLSEAMTLLDRALELNKEETGVLLAMAEVHLLLGEDDLADQRLELATRTNHQAYGGFFLRAYIAWKRGDDDRTRELLNRAVEARGPGWKPEGTTAEGDVGTKLHVDALPLARFRNAWNGESAPAEVFEPLKAHLESSAGDDPE